MKIEKPEQQYTKTNIKGRQKNISNILNTQNSESKEIFDKLKTIIDIADSNIQQKEIEIFIKKRLNELTQNTQNKQETISLALNKIINQFILPYTEIKRAWQADGFKINDPDIYNYLIKTFSKFYKEWNKPALKQLTGQTILYSLGDYFGNYVSNQNTETANIEFYSDHTTYDSETINLEEYKNKKIAVCVEKASVAHNFLKFLGIDSYLIISSDCNLSDNTMAHAYIIFSTSIGKYIFDPTNPVILEDINGKHSYYYPAIYKIAEKDFFNILNKKKNQIHIQHFDKRLINGQYENTNAQIRIYG